MPEVMKNLNTKSSTINLTLMIMVWPQMSLLKGLLVLMRTGLMMNLARGIHTKKHALRAPWSVPLIGFILMDFY
jgi:hypothetical protein